MVAASIAVILLAVLEGSALAGSGGLDPSFSGDGKVATNFTSRADAAFAVAIQADGKVVAAGMDTLAGPFPHSSNERFALARYNTDGSLDTTFGGDGKVTTDLTAGEDIAYDIAIQADGQIVAAGTADGSQFGLTRYKDDGTLDETFSDDGMVFTDLGNGIDYAYGVVIQPDGKIVAAGVRGGIRFGVVRYNSDGTLDSTFSDDGKAITNITPSLKDLEYAMDVALQVDGRIVAGGRVGGSGGRFGLARYNSDGTLDTTFSDDGKVTTDYSSLYDAASGIVIQPVDGKIVAAGTSQKGNDLRFALTRYNADGTLDPTFSGDGKLATRFTAGNDNAESVALQVDGKIIAAGRAGGDGGRFALARFNANGSLDQSFSGDGKVATNFSAGNDVVYGVAIQTSDGNIVACGAGSGQGGTFALARYLAT